MCLEIVQELRIRGEHQGGEGRSWDPEGGIMEHPQGAAREVAQVMANELDWSEQRIEEELESLRPLVKLPEN